jgi:hypothetical protein
MDPITLAIAILAFMSEVLPLLGGTDANGLLHGLKVFVMQCHAESDCNVEEKKVRAS